MGVRESINRNKGVWTALSVVLVVVAVAAVVWQVMGSGPSTAPPRDFFTTDDGQTYFAASVDNIPPFEHEGKQAVKAYVYECGGKPFVGYLERYAPEARQAILQRAQGAQATEAPPASPEGVTGEAEARAKMTQGFHGPAVYGRELKRPGDKEWVKSSDFAKAAQIQNVQCPDGSSTPEPVEP